MKQVIFVLMFLSIFSIASAAEAQVTLFDDMGSFTGAVLRLKSPVTEELGDKIYASESLANVGIMKFEFETSLSEVLLHFMITKNGQVIEEFDTGPYSVNGSEILVDRREKVVKESPPEPLETIEAPEENVANVTEESVEENDSYSQEISEQEPIQNESLEDRWSEFVMTGKSIAKNAGIAKIGMSITGIFIFAIIIFVFIAAKGKKKRNNILGEDDKELAYMEKKVKATEARLSQLKSEREKKKRLEEAKSKLEKEEKELEELEEEERQNSEKIEDL